MRDVLSKKQYKKYRYISRYVSFPIYFDETDGKYVYGTTAALRKDVPYISHKVQEGDTLDTLALYYYNNPTYFWVIADYNNIMDAYSDLTVGSVLKVPTFSSLVFDI